jgi:hypothetical protein
MALEASFVIQAWLNSQGNRDLIQAFLIAWLQEHGDALEAEFVFRAWLRAGGPFRLIKEPALRWIGTFRDRQEATYLSTYVAQQKSSEK